MLGKTGYEIMGVVFFAIMAWMLYRTAIKKNTFIETEVTTDYIKDIK